MAETKPMLNKIPAFDALLGTTISFSWAGSQAQKNRIIIREYATQKIVYDCTQKTMALKHTLHISENTEDKITQNVPYNLKNGTHYLASVYVYDMHGIESLASNEIGFYCYSSPIFKFINFTDVNSGTGIARIRQNSVYLNVKYQQQENEVINEYQFKLYDYNGNLLTESKMFYGSTANDNLRYTLGGITETEKDSVGNLDYNKFYRIVCVAVTTHGMELFTSQDFVVQKDTNGVGALVTLENLKDNTISISSHFKITGVEIDGEEKYIKDLSDEPFAIDLTEGQSVTYSDGFNISSPWSITGIVGNCQENATLLTASNNVGNYFTLSYEVVRYSLVKKAYFLLECNKGNTHYVLRSDYLPISDKWYLIYLKYENGYYTLRVYDPEAVGYEIPEYSYIDKILDDESIVFSAKEFIQMSDSSEIGTFTRNFSMDIDLSSKYNFEDNKYYIVSFTANNVIQNDFNELTAYVDNKIDLSTYMDNNYNTSTKQYLINYAQINDNQNSIVTLSWDNICNATKYANYYKSKTYCLVKNFNVINLSDLGDVYESLISKEDIVNGICNNSISFDLTDDYTFKKNNTYIISFDFENVLYNSEGITLSKAESCDFTCNNKQVSGNHIEYKFKILSEIVDTLPVTISWNNEATYSSGTDIASSVCLIRNLKITRISGTPMTCGLLSQLRCSEVSRLICGEINDSVLIGIPYTYEIAYNISNYNLTTLKTYIANFISSITVNNPENYIMTEPYLSVSIDGKVYTEVDLSTEIKYTFMYNGEENIKIRANSIVFCTMSELNSISSDISVNNFTISTHEEF